VEDNQDLLTRIVSDGHMVINLGFDGESFTGETGGSGDPGTEGRLDQLARTEQAIEELAGYDTRPFWRPPFGDVGQQTLTDAAAAGYGVTVLWGIDSGGDAEAADAYKVSATVVAGASAGSIIRFHLVDGSVDPEALPAIIDDLTGQDYQFVTVEQMLRP
jgi:peptidoglycan/xylan/chitin deacetylase (PgdA/CDA1 family)